MRIFLVQRVPEPTVHAVLRLDTHLANLKHVRSIVFEESRSPDELERRRFLLAHKGGISEYQFHCRLQAWRLGKFRVNLVVLPFVDRTGILEDIAVTIAFAYRGTPMSIIAGVGK